LQLTFSNPDGAKSKTMSIFSIPTVYMEYTLVGVDLPFRVISPLNLA
jgi:hypothetical protein